jgi:hypothetical protein
MIQSSYHLFRRTRLLHLSPKKQHPIWLYSLRPAENSNIKTIDFLKGGNLSSIHRYPSLSLIYPLQGTAVNGKWC